MPVSLLHCHGVILVLYLRDAPCPATSTCRVTVWLQLGGIFQMKLASLTSPNLHHPETETEVTDCQLAGLSPPCTSPLPRIPPLLDLRHITSINGCTLLLEFVTLINTGYLSVSSVFIRK